MMKSTLIGIMIIHFMILISSCTQQTEICSCFETRLEIKNLIRESDDPGDLINTERYKVLKAKKNECLTTIEPAYFEKRGSKRNGRNDKEFLLDELGDCEAVKELLGVNK